MSEPSPNAILGWVLASLDNDEYQRAESLAQAAIIRNAPGLSIERVAEIAEKHSGALVDLLSLHASGLREEGVEANFEMSDDGSTVYIRGTPNRADILLLRALRAITPSEFELFCVKILSKIGATAENTGGRNDGCVDFRGFGLKVGKYDGLLPITSSALLVGQAKKYAPDNFVTLSDLREFVGGAMLEVERWKRRNAERSGIAMPVVLAYWITSEFHKSAKEYAREMGIWYLNGIGLAQLALKIGVAVP